MKKLLVGTVCGLAFATAVFAENAAEIGSVRLKGSLGERLDAMIERHVGGADVDYIAATSFWYQTEPHAPFPAFPSADDLEPL